MSSSEWETLGENIRDMVEDAVKSQDYAKLSQSINTAVNNTLNSVSNGIDSAIRTANQSYRAYDSRVNRNTSYNSVNNRNTVNYTNRTAQFQMEKNQKKDSTSLSVINKNNTALFQKNTSTQVGSILQMAIGYPMAGIMGLSTVGTLVLGSFVGGLTGAGDMIVGGAISGVVTIGFALLAGAGRRKYAMTQRFQAYIRALQGKEYINLDDLAKQTRRKLDFVKKDIQKMLKKQWFVQGHLDNQKTCLMVTDKVYDEYQNNLLQSENLRIEEKQKEEALASDQTKATLKAGNDYINKIRHCNDLIVGEEMTSKITKIELIVKRIFERIEKHPENVPDVRKMMDYYLPTTVKLLEAYAELDNQPIVGENIVNSKKEIEKSLDTLNAAFEKLLDELFKDTAWDVSTDISVLNTILAQDGLTEKDFYREKGR